MLGHWHSYTMQAAGKTGGIPTAGLVFWHPLQEELDILPTGQTITNTGNWTYDIVDGVPCATKSNGNAHINATNSEGIPTGSATRTLSIWLMRLYDNASMVCGWGSQAGAVSERWLYRTATGAVFPPPYQPSGFSAAIGVWHHYATSYDGTRVRSYIDGVLVRTVTPDVATTTAAPYIGASSWQYGFRVAAMRIYDRALKSSEIKELSKEFSPIAANRLTMARPGLLMAAKPPFVEGVEVVDPDYVEDC